ncbi:BMP family lipoprotein [Herbiconiux sp. SYSU D00978]|uniref:BMP family lipoprotein n=1 Tax=Herbiconiux sp. SYSU D00978 TaxID=2812562 RepID=UPI001A96A1AD|nr:BMP family ABC transporter substrate-binding protein [Herbiconiux sp. SYSU D00978]
MRTTPRKAALGGLATLSAIAMLAGCASAPEESGGGTTEASGDFLPCMVSDAGGFDDKSFNQAGFEGLTAAAEEFGVEPITVESADDTVYESNINNLIDQGCTIIVTVGFLLADATAAAAEANPETQFAIVDDASIDAENVKPLTFNTSEAAFLAGYAAASYSETGVVGTFGGMQIPTVTIFMDGFVDGVNYYNEQTGENVQAIGWDVAGQTGSFTGGFAAGTEARNVAQSLIDQNADVIMPVGGPIFLSAGEAIRDAGREIALIGVDSDAYESAPELSDLFLTSVLKGVAAGVEDVVTAAGNDEYSAEPYVGTLENDGVGIAPFHDFEDAVDPELEATLEDLRQQIIDGEIEVESPSALS